VSARQLTREQIRDLPPVITLTTLAKCLGVSEPTIRACHRNGELERLGIRVNRLGLQWRVITSTVLDYLGLGGGDSTVPPPGDGAGQDHPSASALRGTGQHDPGHGMRPRESSSGA
jgi:hypothetical protein